MIFIESYDVIGGGQKILAKIANLQVKLYPQLETYLILTAPSKIIKDLYRKEINIIDVEMRSLNFFGRASDWLKIRKLIIIFPKFFIYQIRLFFKLNKIKDNKVFLSDYRALSISVLPCFLTRKKIYFYAIGGSPFNNKINNFLMKFVFKIYSISDDLAKNLGINDYELVRNGIDISNFSDKMNFQSRESTKERSKFVFVGTLSQNKGVHRLINALKSGDRSNWTLDIYGTFLKDDPYKDYLKDLIGGDDRIKMHGFVKNIHLELKNYHTLIFPSVIKDQILIDNDVVISSSTEGSPTIIIEAVLSGLKVIANDVTGVKDLSNVLPNIFVFNWDDYVDKGLHPDIYLYNEKIVYQQVQLKHRDLFDKSVIDRKLLNDINTY